MATISRSVSLMFNFMAALEGFAGQARLGALNGGPAEAFVQDLNIGFDMVGTFVQEAQLELGCCFRVSYQELQGQAKIIAQPIRLVFTCSDRVH